MKRMLIFWCSVIWATAALGAEQPWLWPIEGRAAGEEILYAPQQYIAREHNFANLYIGGREQERIVAPADGTVHAFGFIYNYSQTYQASYSVDASRPMDEQLEELAARADRSRVKPSFITGYISLRLADGRRIYLTGILFDRHFKTGDRIARGEALGRLHRSFHAIPGLSLNVSVSTAKGRPDDPMTPFGLQSTFVPPQAQAVRERLTAEEASADFAKIMAVLREAYPSLDDTVSPERLAAFEREAADSLAGGISRDRFHHLLSRLEALTHDTHLHLYPDEHRKRNGFLPQLFMGWYGDSCVVTMTQRRHADQVGRRVAKIDGLTADSVRRYMRSRIAGYDASVESVREEQLGYLCTYVRSDRCDQTVEFADGETRTFRGSRSTGAVSDFTQTYLGYVNRNMHREGYELRMIDDSTACLSLSTFQLDEVATDRIVGFIDSIARNTVPNLVVDLRNNGGGEVKVLNRILSTLIDAPSRNKGAMNVVPKRGGYASFEGCCLNYTSDMEIFGDYEPLPDGSGFFSREDCGQLLPDSTVRYRGRLYVLTDAGSASAATLFPAEILRNRRGVIVGRETATAYHYMTALKFADIRLPNSGFQFRIPLVRCIYDTTRNERIPYGRGVLPDYPVSLTRRELFDAPDSILHYALQLIAEGRYLDGEDPFAANDAAPRGRRGGWIPWVCAAAVVLAGRLLYRMRRRA